MRRLIFTADDFGLHSAVNEGVERAHREGLLTAASLMMGEAGVEEAVRIARANPGLAVGLHLTLTDGHPVLPPAQIPSLVQKNGRFRDDMHALGVLLALSPAAQAELHAEVAAQMARFAATGLVCDHVNAHKHYHLHPQIAAALMQAAAGAGVRCIRLPHEPQAIRRAADPAGDPVAEWALGPWCRVLRRRAANWGLRAPDRVFGYSWSGHFTAARLNALIPLLPEGVTELYFHPAARDGFGGGGAGYAHVAELAALTDPAAREALVGTPRGGYRAMLWP
ncbi:hopanoid biosynthesis-associated protein HpnK [Rubritepida flocculans]|uniref:hopanoid biosynthesis-associated protein HpnK n=1 Tax=Rubritepida flocculans TaxID=182403 RepID=UPI00040DE2CF|nr:hopanoid biosynthesis-associated protein HpnK [Rubritepida flocculans]